MHVAVTLRQSSCLVHTYNGNDEENTKERDERERRKKQEDEREEGGSLKQRNWKLEP